MDILMKYVFELRRTCPNYWWKKVLLAYRHCKHRKTIRYSNNILREFPTTDYEYLSSLVSTPTRGSVVTKIQFSTIHSYCTSYVLNWKYLHTELLTKANAAGPALFRLHPQQRLTICMFLTGHDFKIIFRTISYRMIKDY